MCTDSQYCKFPFEYNDKTYTDCTKDGGYDSPWCYTENSWGYCKPCGGMKIFEQHIQLCSEINRNKKALNKVNSCFILF